MKIRLLAIILFFSFQSFSQSNYYTNPVKIPLDLSASFAELRSNHFHSGIDIRTNQVIGIPVNAVAEGFISRIAVSPTGFGKALYIDHPNGTTSVYAHLNNFRDDIEAYVKEEQYKYESFQVNLYPSPERFKLVQDEIIAFSGNSGSSGGPHLHFEIRDTKSEEPLNPLDYGFPVPDKTAPQFFSLLAVPLGENAHVNYSAEKGTYPVVFYDGQFHLSSNPTIPVYGEVGFAVQANDFLDGSWSRCGIISLRLFVDEELYYAFTLDRFAFSETRYLNSHIDFAEYRNTGRRYIKTWKDPGNALRIYHDVKNDGKFVFNDENVHRIKIEVADSYGNIAELVFNVRSEFAEVTHQEVAVSDVFRFNQRNEFSTEEIQLEVPAGTLYDDLEFEYAVEANGEFYSDVHSVHNDKAPLHNSVPISIKTKNLPDVLSSKVLLVIVDENSRNLSAAGGEYNNGWVNGSISSFGNYAVALDTIAPVITPLSIRNNADLTESDRIRFRVSDELSGIEKIEGYLDGNWILFDYDAKSNLITHYFDDERSQLGQRHDFELLVTDNKDNTNVYRASFWK